MNYCKNYDIKCYYALSENATFPCIANQQQCNEFRNITPQKTLGKKINIINNGIFTEIIQNKSGKDPNRTQY